MYDIFEVLLLPSKQVRVDQVSEDQSTAVREASLHGAVMKTIQNAMDRMNGQDYEHRIQPIFTNDTHQISDPIDHHLQPITDLALA